jgi:enamine deaminase RidA (YjgF/YER057c/UK114 family)
MATRWQVPARTAWARTLAYSRAVVVDGQVFVSGTLPVDDRGERVGGDDAYLQARQVLHLLQAALQEAGAALADVVRLRIYLVDAADLAEVARAQFEAFEEVRPACTVLVSALAAPGFRVQMDADALLPARTSHVGGGDEGQPALDAATPSA